MDKSENRFTPGSMLQKYRLVELVSNSANVWYAVDEKLSRDVVLKVLTRSLPADKERREAGIRKVRTGAAFHHVGVAGILDVFADEDDLIVVLERVAGTSLSSIVAERMPEKATVFKWAWQLADAISGIHSLGLVHGAINGSTVMISTSGDVKLTGISLKMLIDRRDRGGPEMLQTNDPHRLMELSYLAPEQISGKPVDARADFFSYGVVMYEAVTQQRPFSAANATDLANQIVKGQPRQPYELNPRMHQGMAGVIGKCLAKDPYGRYASAKLISADLKKAELAIETIALRASAAGPRVDGVVASVAREAVVLVGDIPYYDLLQRESAAKASEIAAVMQQIVGEAIYLYDGVVLDNDGSRIIGTLPDSMSALRALEKARNDLAERNLERTSRGADHVEPRIVVHAGQVTDTPVGGRAIEQSMLMLGAMQPAQMLVSQRPIHDAKLAARSRQIGSLQGIALWEPPGKIDPDPEPVAEGEAAEFVPPQKKRNMALIGAIGIGLAAALIAGGWFMTRKSANPPAPVVAQTVVQAPAESERMRVRLEPFVTTSTNPDDAAKLRKLEASVLAVLATVPDLDVVNAPAAGVTIIGGRVTTEQPGELVPAFSKGGLTEGPAIALTKSGEAANALLMWLAEQMKIAPEQFVAANGLAIDHFSEAASQPAGVARISAIKAAITADPTFVPAARLAFAELSPEKDASLVLRAGERLSVIEPKNLEVRRKLVDLLAQQRDLPAAGPHLAALVAGDDRSRKTLATIARMALAAGDADLFTKAERTIRTSQTTGAVVHAPDIVAARGRFDTAVQLYYAIEQIDPANKVLALKIGRLAILRRSPAVADSELQKLQKLDPDYGFHLLSAYIAAEKRDVAGAEREIALARANAPADAEIETAAAEIYAILSQHSRVMRALRKANERNEPTYAYILANPLFAYLRDDPSFAKSRADIEKKRDAIASAISQIRL